MSKRHLFVVLLILGTAFWGISFSVTKLAIGAVSQSTFLVYRFVLATLVLAIVLFKQLMKTSKRNIVQGIRLAIPLTLGIHFQTLGIKYTAASQCAFVAGMCVIVIPILKSLVYRKTVAPKIWLASLVALAGLFVISITSSLSVSIGDLYTITGTFGFSVYLIKVEEYSGSGEVVKTIVPMFATCTLIMLCVALTDSTANWIPQNHEFWMGIVFCALLSTAYMYTISNLAQRYISAERVAIIYLFEPIFAAIAAIVLLDEQLTWRLLVGGLLIFIGTLISEVKWKRREVSAY